MKRQAIETAVKFGRDEYTFRQEFLDELNEEQSLATESENRSQSDKSLSNSESEKEEQDKIPEENLFQTLLPHIESVKEVRNKADKFPNKVKMLAQVLKNVASEAERAKFGEEQREKIIHTASVFRKERDLKVVSKYWKRWKCII